MQEQENQEIKPVVEKMDTKETVYSSPPPVKVKLNKWKPLQRIAQNEFRTPCGSIYGRTDNGNLVRLNKSNTPSKKIRSKMKRLKKYAAKGIVKNPVG